MRATWNVGPGCGLFVPPRSFSAGDRDFLGQGADHERTFRLFPAVAPYCRSVQIAHLHVHLHPRPLFLFLFPALRPVPAGAWVIHVVLIVLGKILLDVVPGMEQDVSWTFVNLGYIAVSSARASCASADGEIGKGERGRGGGAEYGGYERGNGRRQVCSG